MGKHPPSLVSRVVAALVLAAAPLVSGCGTLPPQQSPQQPCPPSVLRSTEASPLVKEFIAYLVNGWKIHTHAREYTASALEEIVALNNRYASVPAEKATLNREMGALIHNPDNFDWVADGDFSFAELATLWLQQNREIGFDVFYCEETGEWRLENTIDMGAAYLARIDDFFQQRNMTHKQFVEELVQDIPQKVAAEPSYLLAHLQHGYREFLRNPDMDPQQIGDLRNVLKNILEKNMVIPSPIRQKKFTEEGLTYRYVLGLHNHNNSTGASPEDIRMSTQHPEVVAVYGGGGTWSLECAENRQMARIGGRHAVPMPTGSATGMREADQREPFSYRGQDLPDGTIRFVLTLSQGLSGVYVYNGTALVTHEGFQGEQKARVVVSPAKSSHLLVVDRMGDFRVIEYTPK